MSAIVPQRECSSCKQVLPTTAFSAKQLKAKASTRRCSDCVSGVTRTRTRGELDAAAVESARDAGSTIASHAGGLCSTLKATSLEDPSDSQSNDVFLDPSHRNDGFRTRMQDFVLRYYSFIGGFAAQKLRRHGPGALFLFTNVPLDALLDSVDDRRDRSLDRQVILSWGSLRRPKDETAFRFDELHQNVRRFTTTLKENAQRHCDRTQFPLCIVSDPTCETCFPPAFRELGLARRTGETGGASMQMRFFDYSKCLKFGQMFARNAVAALSLDRKGDATSGGEGE